MTNNLKKYFPISTPTACQAKWNWSTLYLYQGTSASCHRTGWDNLTPNNFNNFHNLPTKLQDRQAMLNGQWPQSSCSYCKHLEQKTGTSDRIRHLAIPNMYPPELENDPSAIQVSATLLEVYFDNVCNMACLYCVPSLSSSINQEHAQFGEFSKQGVHLFAESKHIDHSVLLDKFWQWMNNESQQLRRLHVLGGEPLYQKEFYKLLEFFEKNPRPKLELNFITNLMITPDRLEFVIGKFKHLLAKRCLGRVDITCSIDCWGPEQEYVRWGLVLDQWQANFESLLTKPWLTININQTLSVLTIKTMPELLRKLEQWRQKHQIGQFFSEVDPHPLYLKPNILGSDVFAKDFESIIALMPADNEQNAAGKKYMQGIAEHIAVSKSNSEQKRNLKIFLDEKDRRRGTLWSQTFPWLIKELGNVV